MIRKHINSGMIFKYFIMFYFLLKLHLQLLHIRP